MTLQPATLVQGISAIASLPSIYERLNEVVRHPRSSARDIGNVVSEDPGLTARLLRLVNSAFYGFPSKVETVSRAIMMIGTQQLRELSLATSIMKAFKDMPKDLIDMDAFWRHSLGCGVICRVLATHRRENNVERFFVAGLLHDIGCPIMYLKIPEKMREVLELAKRNQICTFSAEQEVLGFDHAEIGQLLLKAWNLPASLQEAAGCHHSPAKATLYPLEATLVHVSNIIANALEWGSSGERMIPDVAPGVWESLKLSEQSLSAMIREVEQQYADAIKIILKDAA